MGEQRETAAGRSEKKMGASGEVYQPVGVGNAPNAKTPTSKRENLVARCPDKFASGLRQEGRIWPRMTEGLSSTTGQLTIRWRNRHPRESKGAGDQCDRPNIDY